MFRSLHAYRSKRVANGRSRPANRNSCLSLEPLEERAVLSANVINLGISGVPNSLQIDGDNVAFTVRELHEGSTDLNGDGDAFDNVLHVHDAATGATKNLGFAANDFFLDGDLLGFFALEQDGPDLNGDGDTNDQVVHVYDFSTDVVTNLGLTSGSHNAFGDNLFAFGVTEFAQGNTDLNGDGDTSDAVMHVYDASTGTITNLGLANSVYLRDVQIAGNLVGFAVREDGQGETDLNGDGDATDLAVLHVYDANTGVTKNLGLEGPQFVIGDDFVAMSVRESFQGNTDLNSDGDANDSVVHVYDASNDTITNLAVLGSGFETDGRYVAFLGPGAVHVYDSTTGVLTNVGLSANGLISPMNGGRIVFPVYEVVAGADLNGDGDMTDVNVIHVYDANTGVLTGLDLSGSSPQVTGDLVTFLASEFYEGGDLNGDGDANDRVLHAHDLSTGVTTNLGLSVLDESIIENDVLAFTVREAEQNDSDLNGDGDATDLVLHVYDAAKGTTTNLALADSFLPRLSGSRVAFAVSEANQGGTDLNGDGDADDNVIHLVDFSVQEVEIDIRPGTENDLIRVDSNGVLAVALLSTEDFDASMVNLSSVQFAGAFAIGSMLQDVDQDGDLDLVLRFRISDTVLDEIYAELVEQDLNDDGVLDSNHQDAELSLTGETLGGQAFEGADLADLFLTGRDLRDLLDELAKAQIP